MATITCLYAKIYAEIHSDTGTLGRLGTNHLGFFSNEEAQTKWIYLHDPFLFYCFSTKCDVPNW